MNPQEIFSEDDLFNAGELRDKIEENFIELGGELSKIKDERIYKVKGYQSFKDFIEDEVNFSNSLANKLISIYNTFIVSLNKEEVMLAMIGFDKLSLILPIVNKVSKDEAEKWIGTAVNNSSYDLREFVKQWKEEQKKNKQTPKDILIEQWRERMVQESNLSQKGITYMLALYFSDKNLEEVFDEAREKMLAFEKEFERNKEN